MFHFLRYGYNRSPVDYEDTQGFCGGQSVQWGQNGGRCGLCGDPYNGLREHEAPGGEAFSTDGKLNGILQRKIRNGCDSREVQGRGSPGGLSGGDSKSWRFEERMIEIDGSSFLYSTGYFSFRLCPLEDEAEATQACMDSNVLGLAFTVMEKILNIKVLTLHFRIQQNITLRTEELAFLI